MHRLSAHWRGRRSLDLLLREEAPRRTGLFLCRAQRQTSSYDHPCRAPPRKIGSPSLFPGHLTYVPYTGSAVPRSLPVSNPVSRFVSTAIDYDEGEAPQADLEVYEDQSKSILATNDSPDVGFRWSVNPYRG